MTEHWNGMCESDEFNGPRCKKQCNRCTPRERPKAVQASLEYMVSCHPRAASFQGKGYVYYGPEITKAFMAGVAFERKRYVDDPAPDDLYMLKSIYRQLHALKEEAQEGHSLGGEALADNVNWLNCFIDKHGGKVD